MVSAAAKQYLYREMENGQAAPILDFYKDPEQSVTANEEPDFLYSPDYPYHRVVEFYSPMCPHCVRFAPHYVEFARHFNRLTQHSLGNITNTTSASTIITTGNHYTGMQVEFHAVSCLVHRPICAKQKIRSYPFLMVFRKGSFEGKRMNHDARTKKQVVKIG